MRRLVVVIGITVGAACQARNPATATSPTSFDAENRPLPSGSTSSSPAVLTFVSGENQQPVGAAKVTVDGRTYTTGGSGQVAVDRGSREVDVQASGFMTRRASFTGDHFSLWPLKSPTGLDLEFTARVVYNCTAAACTDVEALGRLPDGPVSVVPSRDLRSDPVALGVLQEAVLRYAEATHGQIAYQLDQRASAAVVIDVGVDPNDPAILANAAAGVTRRDYAGSAISHAAITLRSLDLAHRLPLLLHELGHAFGLSHSPYLGDIMWNGPELYDLPDLSSRELLGISLMLQRSSGNRFPDSEGVLLASRTASSPRTSIVVD